jgi:lipopolysaccharide/colanic/teichoic acid biosynthesis glycosyltransferase
MPMCGDACQRDAIVRLDVPHSTHGAKKLNSSSAWYRYAKVVLDAALALTMLVLSLPLLVIAAIAIKLNSRGPVFYSQVRLGLRGRPFRIYKLRTMFDDCEKLSGIQWSTPGDPRVTAVGRFLRRSHIDELPQLWNVLRGDMSLVGPRPERPEFVPQLEIALPRYRDRLLVRPGVTGLAQVQLPADTDLDSVRRKLAHDLHYAERCGLWLDLRILLSTGLHILGLSYAKAAKLFSLPGGAALERSYLMSLTPAPAAPAEPKPAALQDTVIISADATVNKSPENGAPAAPQATLELQPA